MNLPFRDAVAAALPSEERLRTQLEGLPVGEWTELALVFAALLPEVDAVLGLPDAGDLAGALAEVRGILAVDALAPLQGGPGQRDVVLVTRDLTDGMAELRALLNAEHFGGKVRAVVAAITRTDELGHVRLELQGLPVLSAVRLAGTPGGLVFERRIPNALPQAS